MNDEKRLIGTNFKTRAIINFIIEKEELRIIASFSKDYFEFVELVISSSCDHYDYKRGIYFKNYSEKREMIYWNDPEIIVEEVNLYLKDYVFKNVA